MKKNKVTNDLRQFIISKLKIGWLKAEIIRQLVTKTGWGKTKAREAVAAVIEDSKQVEISPKEESSWSSSLELKEAYIYNKDDDKYVFQTKKVPSGAVVLSGTVVRAIHRGYVGGETTNSLARRYTIPRAILTEVISKLGLTHDSLPFTNEEIKTKSDSELIIDTLEQRKFELFQKLEKETWKDTQANANKWMEFKANSLDPFVSFLSNWKPPEYQPVKAPKYKNTDSNRAFVVGAFDWHIGAREEARYMWKGNDWNLAAANNSVNRYAAKILEHVQNDVKGFNRCVFLLGGDLYNSLTGFTANGTPMNNEFSRDTQFEAVMNLLIQFINHLLSIFPNVECHFVRGNHGGTTDIPLAWAIKNYFHTENRLIFDISSCRTKPIRVNSVLMLIDHGASDQTKSLLPANGKAKESYIQHLLLANPDLLIGVKQKLFIQGDLHHYQQREYNDFEFFMFGALPCGSQYADTKNMHNRPRQNCLIVGDDGVEQVLHVYLD